MVANSKEKPRPQAADSFFKEPERIFQNEQGARLITKVIRELIDGHQYADPVALREAVEERCRKLGLECSRDIVERALDLVASNAQLFARQQRKRPTAAPTQASSPPPSQAEAKALLDKLGIDVNGGRLSRQIDRSRLTPM